MSSPSCRRVFATLAIFFFLWLAAGCVSPPYRTGPEFKEQIKGIQKLALVDPIVEVHEVSATGYVQPRYDLSMGGKQDLKRAFLQAFREKHYHAISLDACSGFKEEISHLRSVYKLVNKSILLHSYGPQVFPEKIRSFDYGVGPVEKITKAARVDCLVFVTARNQISEAEQKAYLSAAVVNSSGIIVWYCVKGWKGKPGLTDSVAIAGLAEEIVSSFPQRVQ